MVVELTPTKFYPGGSRPFVKYTPEGGSFALCAALPCTSTTTTRAAHATSPSTDR